MQIEKYPVSDLEEWEEDCVDYSHDPFSRGMAEGGGGGDGKHSEQNKWINYKNFSKKEKNK